MDLSKNPIIFLFKRIWKYSEGNRRMLSLSVILSSIAHTLTFVGPLIVALLLNTIQAEGITNANIYKLIGIVLLLPLLTIVMWALHGPARVLERKNAFLLRKNYQKYLIRGTLALPLAWHTDHHSGDTIDKVGKGSTALYQAASNIYKVISVIAKFITSYIILVFFNIHAAYIVVIIVILAFATIIRIDDRLRKQYANLFKIDNEISAKVFDSISNITTVIILRIQNLISKDIEKKIMKPFKLFSKNAKLNETKWFLVSFYSSLMLVLVLSTYIFNSLFTGEIILVGTLYVLYEYVRRIQSAFSQLASEYGEFVRYKSAVENAEKLSKDFIEETVTTALSLGKWNQMKIRKLCFSYYNRKDGYLNLDNVSLTIRRGEKIALVGESGSGKTTFMKLLKGLYEPNRVQLYVDDKGVLDNFNILKNSSALIPQEPEVFATTIRKNITVGIHYSFSELEKYTKLACFDKVVKKLPKKYESSIVEKGVNLSGGEKQRLVLTRGLLAAKDTPIILMDEPTSSVDTANELKIFNNMFRHFKKRTIISSVHRLHLLDMFDTIYFLDQGRIVASGTLKELLNTSKKFKKLYNRYMAKKN